MSKEYIDKLAFIEVRDNKVLMARSKGKDKWYCVGGKREKGESDEQALLREVKEEIQVHLDVASIAYYGTFQAQAHGQPEGTQVRLTCYTGSYEGEPQATSEIEEISWLQYSDKDRLTEPGRLAFEDLKQKGLIH